MLLACHICVAHVLAPQLERLLISVNIVCSFKVRLLQGHQQRGSGRGWKP